LDVQEVRVLVLDLVRVLLEVHVLHRLAVQRHRDLRPHCSRPPPYPSPTFDDNELRLLFFTLFFTLFSLFLLRGYANLSPAAIKAQTATLSASRFSCSACSLGMR